MASAITEDTSLYSPVRQSFRPIHVVRTTAITAARVFDALCALTVMLATFVTLNVGRMPGALQEFLTLRLTVKNFVVALLLLLIWHTSFAAFGLYQATLVRSFQAAATRIVLACSLASVFMPLFITASPTGAFNIRVVLLFWLVSVVVELAGRGALATAARYAERKARNVRVAVIVGSGPRALKLWRSIEAREFQDWHVAGFVDEHDYAEMAPEIRSRLLGSLSDLEDLLSRAPVDQLLIALPVKSQYVAIEHALEICERVGVEAKYFPDIFKTSRARRALDADDDVPSMRVRHVADDHRMLIKRALDIVGAAGGLLVLSPVFLACAIAVRVTSKGPAIFTQERYGYNRRRFRLYKFRTMVQGAEALQAGLEAYNELEGPVFKIRADPRITPVGRFLRRTSLDELPQLVNVLKGDMSLVGPRPLAVRDVQKFDAGWLMRRFSVRPGLTCLWQINGRNNTNFDEWVRLDLNYIDNWSLALDMQILLKTVPAVLSGSGAM